MNEHLQPIFKTILPSLERNKIPYWVFGGVAVAGINGNFFRKNQDIDIFVEEKNYEKTVKLIEIETQQFNWFSDEGGSNVLGRPKKQFYPKGSDKDILSVTFFKQTSDKITFLFPNVKPMEFSISTLPRVKRIVGQESFTSLPDAILKSLFKYYMKYNFQTKRIDTKDGFRQNYDKDVKVLFPGKTLQEIAECLIN